MASLAVIQTAIGLTASYLNVKITSIYLGPAGIGLLGQLQYFMDMSLGILAGGVTVGITRLTAEDHDNVARRRLIVSSVARGLMVLGPVLSLILIVSSGWLAERLFHDAGHSFALMLFGAVLTFGLFGGLLTGLARAAKDYKSTTYIQSGAAVTAVVLMAIFCPTYGIVGGLAAAAVSPLVPMLIATIAARGTTWFDFGMLRSGFSRNDLLRVSHFVPMSATVAVVAPFTQLTIRNFLATHSGMEAVGLLHGVVRLSDLYLGIFTNVLLMYYLPRFSEIKSSTELRREITRCLALVVTGVAAASVMIYLLRDLMITVLFTRDFLPMRDLFAWQMTSNVLRIVFWVMGYALIAASSPYLYAGMEALAGGLWMVCAYWLVPLNGAEGAVQSGAVAYCVSIAISACLVVRGLRRMRRNET